MIVGTYTVKIPVKGTEYCLHSLQQGWNKSSKPLDLLISQNVDIDYVSFDFQHIDIGSAELCYTKPVSKGDAEIYEEDLLSFLDSFRIDMKGRLIRNILSSINDTHSYDRYKSLKIKGVHWGSYTIEWWLQQTDEEILKMYTTFVIQQFKQR